jgi:hypothetical protein
VGALVVALVVAQEEASEGEEVIAGEEVTAGEEARVGEEEAAAVVATAVHD